MRVFTSPSSRAGPVRARGGRPSASRSRPADGGTVSRQGHGYTHAAFGWSVHRSSLSTIPGFPRVKERAEQLVGKAREAVPEGTFAVGGGLMITALTTYVFLIVANQALPDKPYAALNAFWALHLRGRSRACSSRSSRRWAGRVAHRRAQGLGGGPLVHRAARLAGLLTVAMVVLAIVAVAALRRRRVPQRRRRRGRARDRARRLRVHAPHARHAVGQRPLPALRRDPRHRRHREAGRRRSSSGRSASRAPAPTRCASRSSPFVATGIALIGQHGLLEDGPEAPYSELSKSLGWLLAGSLLMQTLGYSVLLGVGVLKGDTSKTLVARAQQRVLRRPRPATAVPGGAGHAAAEAGGARRAPAATTTSAPGSAAHVHRVRHRRARHRSPRS